MKEKKELFKNIIRGLLVFVLFFNSVYIQLIPVIIFKLDLNNLSNSMSVILSTFSSLILVFILFFIYRKDLIKEFKLFKDNLMKNIDIGFKAWITGVIIMVIANLIIITLFKSGMANNEQAVQQMISSLPWLMLINAGLLAPFNEEIVFRKTLKDVFKNKWVYVFLSFLLFGGAHVFGTANNLVDYLYIIPYGALGGAFAYAYYKTDSIFTPMFLHVFHNTVLCLVSIFL